jgi:hypothetical protein
MKFSSKMTSWFFTKKEDNEQPTPYREYVVLALLCYAAFAVRQFLLRQSAFPPGSDAYIYLVQVHSIIEEHRMHYADISLIYPYFTAISLIIRDYITAYITGISLLTALFTFACFLFTRRSGRVAAFFIAVWSVFSPLVFFAASQYPKNFLALCFFIFMMWALRSRRIFLFILFFMCALTTHRMTAVLSLFFCFSYLIVQKRRPQIIVRTLIGGTVICILLSFLPGTLHISDLDRFKGIIASSLQFAPLTFINMSAESGLHPLFIFELFLSFVLVCAALVIGVQRYKKRPMPSWVLCLLPITCIPLLPFLHFDAQGPVYRLYLFTLPLTFLFIAPIFRMGIRTGIIASLVVSAFGGLYVITEYPQRSDPPYALYASLAKSAGVMLSNEKCELIVAHRPFAETADYYLRRDTLAWKPENSFNKNNVWRIAHSVEKWEIDSVIGPSLAAHDTVWQLSAQYILIREDVWDKFIAGLSNARNPDLSARALSAFNPSEIRPKFITRSK